MGRDFLPKYWVKKHGLLKINLLPKKNTLLSEILYKLQLQHSPASRIDWTYNTQVYRKTFFFAREKFDLCLPGQ